MVSPEFWAGVVEGQEPGVSSGNRGHLAERGEKSTWERPGAAGKLRNLFPSQEKNLHFLPASLQPFLRSETPSSSGRCFRASRHFDTSVKIGYLTLVSDCFNLPRIDILQ
jgi:hypothetical protein